MEYKIDYLERRMSNLQCRKGPNGDIEYLPAQPEVFLDDSYCHLDHTAPNKWVKSNDGVANEFGRKPILVIFEAFVVFYNEETNTVDSKFVEDSVYI
ncbi:hypothetical protein BGX30_003689 [Mortierella sp. GBA39]|nr:hypothetical protein BGX30_003689 [Mortierella sp. GBA39]